MGYFEDLVQQIKTRLKRDGFDDLKLSIDISFWKRAGDGSVIRLDYLREPLEQKYHVTKKRIAQKGDRSCVDDCRFTIDGITFHYFSESYPNPEFDKEYCIRNCAEQREKYRILSEHKNEMNVEKRIQSIKDKTEIGCYSP